jgi:hypothetical protein
MANIASESAATGTRLAARLCLVFSITASLAACGGRNPEPRPAGGGSTAAYVGLQLSALPGYHATFELLFAGQKSWRYQLELRADGAQLEYRLHIEGPGQAQNPGDVRLVASGGTSRMLGAGTDDQCVQFPSDLNLGQSFVTPDHLVAPEDLAPVLRRGVDDDLNGVPSQHYTAREAVLGPWRDAQVDVWLDSARGSVLGYKLLLSGSDPLFGGGVGTLAGTFRVNAVGPQSIEPVPGCEIDLPIPADAARLVKLPGLITFESAASMEEVAAFFQTRLPEAGWLPEGEPLAGGDALVLAYRRAEDSLNINIEPNDTGARVDLLQTTGQ